ncbi:hypothetical protein LINPERPRIM_LOCUS29825, partial [Linum perenne]
MSSQNQPKFHLRVNYSLSFAVVIQRLLEMGAIYCFKS